MQYQEATSVIAASMGELERRLAEVESWPRFLAEVDRVEVLAAGRYRFWLIEGRSRREAVVAVRHLCAAHRFAWKALAGPAYAGLLELGAVDDGHCRVRLASSFPPCSLAGGLMDMLVSDGARVAVDLHRLEVYAGAGRVPAPRTGPVRDH